jgi:hypothetical protein
MVLVGTIGTGFVSAAQYINRKHKLPPTRLAIGVFAAAIVLSVIADAAPNVGGGLAALMLVTALTSSTAPWDALDALLAHGPK